MSGNKCCPCVFLPNGRHGRDMVSLHLDPHSCQARDRGAQLKTQHVESDADQWLGCSSFHLFGLFSGCCKERVYCLVANGELPQPDLDSAVTVTLLTSNLPDLSLLHPIVLLRLSSQPNSSPHPYPGIQPGRAPGHGDYEQADTVYTARPF